MISNFEFRLSNFPPNNPFCPKLAAEFGLRNEELGIPPIPRSKLVRGRKFEIRNSKFEILFLVLVLMLIVGCAHRGAKQPSVRPSEPTPAPTPLVEQVEEGYTEKGIASWYGEPYHGRRTASGEVYDMHRMTAAHKTLPFGSIVKINRSDTGADVKVRINDRGPFIEGRIIDLSYAAAKKIGLDHDGVAPVKIKVVGRENVPERKAMGAEDPEICFWVQVGAFTDSENARKAERELDRSGEEAVVLEGFDGLWKVRVGPFDKPKAAEKARNRVTDAWPGAHVVPCGG
jgi:rare lipoprotein A